MTSESCDLCPPPDLPINYQNIWDNIPCPPEEITDYLFSPDLINKIGPEKGINIVLTIAERCNIEVPKLYPTMGHVSGSWMFNTCGEDCISTTVGICVSVFLVMALVVFAGFARRELGWFKPSSRDRYVIEHISTIISEDGNITDSNYKFMSHRSQGDTLERMSKIDEELSSIYVARWYKIFVAENCTESQHSIDKHSPNSKCICKRLAEHIYEDIDNCKAQDETSEILSDSYQKYSYSNENIVLLNRKEDTLNSSGETNLTLSSTDYQTLNRSGNHVNEDENDDKVQDRSSSNSCLNEYHDVYFEPPLTNDIENYDDEDDHLLDNRVTLLANVSTDQICFERLNSHTSAHSRTPLIHNESSDSDISVII